MLSSGAFNALLKTLEEPPEHVKFILATTEPQKLPATILSRCQRFDFKIISKEDIIKRLKIVCNESNIEATEGALNIIAVLSEGAMRDALSILERCIQDGENKIDEDKIKDLVGIPKTIFVNKIVDGIIEYDIDKSLQSINDILDEGKDIDNFLWEIIKYIKDILVYMISNKLDLYSSEELEGIKKISQKVQKQRLVDLIYELSELQNSMKWSTQKNIMFQAGIIKLCSKDIGIGNSLQERIEKIEKYLKSTNISNNTASRNIDTNSIYKNVSDIESTSINTNNGKIIQKEKKQQTENKIDVKKYSNNLSQSWPKIVNDLKQNGKRVLSTYLENSNIEEINDMTVGIKFPNGLSSFGKTILEKQENVKELSNLVSMVCGKEMQIKYISEMKNQVTKPNIEDDIQKLAQQSNIPFNVIE